MEIKIFNKLNIWEFVYIDKPRCWVHCTLSVIRKVNRCTALFVPSTIIINIFIACSVNSRQYFYDVNITFIIFNYTIFENITLFARSTGACIGVNPLPNHTTLFNLSCDSCTDLQVNSWVNWQRKLYLTRTCEGQVVLQLECNSAICGFKCAEITLFAIMKSSIVYLFSQNLLEFNLMNCF